MIVLLDPSDPANEKKRIKLTTLEQVTKDNFSEVKVSNNDDTKAPAEPVKNEGTPAKPEENKKEDAQVKSDDTKAPAEPVKNEGTTAKPEENKKENNHNNKKK